MIRVWACRPPVETHGRVSLHTAVACLAVACLAVACLGVPPAFPAFGGETHGRVSLQAAVACCGVSVRRQPSLRLSASHRAQARAPTPAHARGLRPRSRRTKNTSIQSKSVRICSIRSIRVPTPQHPLYQLQLP
jgi:hypothetical protein